MGVLPAHHTYSTKNPDRIRGGAPMPSNSIASLGGALPLRGCTTTGAATADDDFMRRN